MSEKKQEDWEMTLHVILSGVYMNGVIKGETGGNYNEEVLEKAKKQIEKLYRQKEQEIRKEAYQQGYKKAQSDYYNI